MSTEFNVEAMEIHTELIKTDDNYNDLDDDYD